jgi:uncharacterized protein (TIGR02680 family)
MTVTELPRRLVTAVPGEAPRWIPSRAGILNVWRYYDEVFTFHDGRLLLRGPNGSGKSKALELLLPFLFDANLRASRLSTFGTAERTMHWNLMGEGAAGTTRVGYVWLEFHYPGAPDRWFCCGARLQASTHTTTVHADYFTTSQRIGARYGLSLINEAGQPLTKNDLEQCLGDQGTLHGNAGDYRSAVRSALFPGLTEQRFDALITALLQLRTPKLSQRLDPALLSTLLSRALPPLGDQEIADLAEGFERLDRQRERLAALDEEVAATRTLAGRQRAYAQRVLRATAATLISATTELDNLTRAARGSAEEYDSVADRKAATERRKEDLEHDAEAISARIEGITQSDAYQQGRDLDRLRQETKNARDRATVIRADAGQKRSEADTDQSQKLAAQHVVDRQTESVRMLGTEARHAATRAAMGSVHAEIEAGLETGPARCRPLLRAAVHGRHDQLAVVRRALDQHDRAVDRRSQAEADLDAARTVLSDAQEQQAAAAERHDEALSRLTSRLAAWAGACRELAFPRPEALLELAGSEPAVIEFVGAAAATVMNGITRDQTTAQARRESAQAERDQLAEQVQFLTKEREMPPDPPRTRTTDRSKMTGAPFWRLIDFAATTPDSVQGPVEAALEAAGLLDAWVGMTGAVAGHDLFADPGALPPAPGRSLADVLVPEADAGVPAESIRKLLTAIAFDSQLPAGHPAAIGADGSWRMANLHGSWHKDRPAHIGAAARQRAREQRIRELNAQVEESDQAIARLDTELGGLKARLAVVANERASRPDHQEVNAAAEVLTRADSDVAAADRVVGQRLGTVSARAQHVAAALRTLTNLAAENALPTERDALATLEQAVNQFRDQAENWLDGHGQLASARQALAALTTQADRSTASAGQREQEADEAAAKHRQMSAMLQAVEETAGADYREILERLSGLREELGNLRSQLSAAGQEVIILAGRLGELDGRRAADAQARDGATSARDVAAHRFRHLATGVFAADSGIADPAKFAATLSGSDGVRATLGAARQVAAAWPTLTYAPGNIGDALHRLLESLHACRSTLSARADLDMETDEDVQVFTAVIDGVRVGAAELLRTLTDEAERSRQEITDRERELFDKTLTGDTRRHLADRIRQANELVDRMNSRLERVRTASKVAVRLVWQVAPDLPAGTKAARDLLLKDPVRLSEADRESLHRFFRERIEQARADDTATSWEQQLAQVFDYTSWHQFVVKVDRANGAGWQLLTRKLHGALSGGEKAIALHLPLFAAVAAHYQAVPEAPRVILLDEVFVGVDTSNRGQVFALLSALELDLVLTSDHEWCTYAELSGIGIHQLITGSDGDDAVTTARFTWDGHELVSADQDA